MTSFVPSLIYSYIFQIDLLSTATDIKQVANYNEKKRLFQKLRECDSLQAFKLYEGTVVLSPKEKMKSKLLFMLQLYFPQPSSKD